MINAFPNKRIIINSVSVLVPADTATRGEQRVGAEGRENKSLPLSHLFYYP